MDIKSITLADGQVFERVSEASAPSADQTQPEAQSNAQGRTQFARGRNNPNFKPDGGRSVAQNMVAAHDLTYGEGSFVERYGELPESEMRLSVTRKTTGPVSLLVDAATVVPSRGSYPGYPWAFTSPVLKETTQEKANRPEATIVKAVTGISVPKKGLDRVEAMRQAIIDLNLQGGEQISVTHGHSCKFVTVNADGEMFNWDIYIAREVELLG